MDELIVRRPVGPAPLAVRLAAVLAVPLVLYALVATGQKAIENYRMNREADGLRTEIASLRAENIGLQQQIEQARSDVAIETIAREQLGLVKPGDHALAIAADSAPRQQSAATPVAPAAPPPPPPAWRQWFDLFFG